MPRTFRSKTLAGRVRAVGALESQLCLLRTNFCLPWTAVAASHLCQGGRLDSSDYGRRLAELKSDLREALTEVQVHEKEIAGPVVQAARLALDELEGGLKEILQQVEQAKRKRSR
jgi:hypothetical protein